MSQLFVGLSGAGPRNAPRNSVLPGARLWIMKSRFPSDRRASWRERFVAIARQADGAPRLAPELDAPRPRIRSLSATVAFRVRFAAISTH